ncbi:MAG: hypothetical protein ACRDWY_18755, partial [Actinomycetes bacterium]
VDALDRAARTEALPLRDGGARRQPDHQESGEYDGRRRSPGLVAAAMVVALLLIGGLVALALLTGGDEDPDGKAGRKDTPSAPTTTATTPPPSSTAETTPADDGAPAGFTTYEDPSGFSVAVPEGWQAEQVSATAVDIKEPGTSRFLRIDQTDDPEDDPKKDWEEQEKSVEDELPDYERIAIEEVDYNGWPAADWEFTFGDSPTHVLNRGFVPSDERGYALYLSTPDEQWAESVGVFQTAAETFIPADD